MHDALDELGVRESRALGREVEARGGRDVGVGIHVDDERLAALVEAQVDARVVAQLERLECAASDGLDARALRRREVPCGDDLGEVPVAASFDPLARVGDEVRLVGREARVVDLRE